MAVQLSTVWATKQNPGALQALTRRKCWLLDVDDTWCTTTKANEMQLERSLEVIRRRGACSAQSDDEIKRSILRVIIDAGADHKHALLMLQNILGIDVKLAMVVWCTCEKASIEGMKLVPGTRELLTFLHERGCKVAAITNSNDSYIQMRKAIFNGTLDLFNEIIISGDVGVEKPDPAIFKLALKKLNCELSDAVMVGDSLRLDIKPANELGILSVRVRQGRNASIEPQNEAEMPTLEFANLAQLSRVLMIACSPPAQIHNSPKPQDNFIQRLGNREPGRIPIPFYTTNLTDG